MAQNQDVTGGKVRGYGAKGERIWGDIRFKVRGYGAKGEDLWGER